MRDANSVVDADWTRPGRNWKSPVSVAEPVEVANTGEVSRLRASVSIVFLDGRKASKLVILLRKPSGSPGMPS
ncbi:MAG: hypothetical protein R2697_05315 [Ilumatobacteraceae bacterium]